MKDFRPESVQGGTAPKHMCVICCGLLASFTRRRYSVKYFLQAELWCNELDVGFDIAWNCLAQIEDLWTLFRISSQTSSEINTPRSVSHIVLSMVEELERLQIFEYIEEIAPLIEGRGLKNISKSEGPGRAGNPGNKLQTKCRGWRYLKKCALEKGKFTN